MKKLYIILLYTFAAFNSCYSQYYSVSRIISHGRSVDCVRVTNEFIENKISSTDDAEVKYARGYLKDIQAQLNKLAESTKVFGFVQSDIKTVELASNLLDWIKRDNFPELQALYQGYEKEINFYKLLNESSYYGWRQFLRDSIVKQDKIRLEIENFKADSAYRVYLKKHPPESIRGTVVVGPGYSSTTNRTYSKSSRPKTQHVSSYGRKSKSGKTTYVKSYKRSRKR